MENFEKLLIWQESMAIAKDIYGLLKDCKDFGLKDQMQRASISIPSNIAEGSERSSDKEFVRFLRIAKGSLAELRTQLLLATELEIVHKETGEKILQNCLKTSKMIQKFITARSKNF
ncbi:MAG: four helix bundle protein [Bacteroidetes bacterium]|nr:MAG: four helix bundle protein [Bacteroidota bacterium]